MRLIDANALREFFDDTPPNMIITSEAIQRIIDKQPTVSLEKEVEVNKKCN
jgi:hypothetical protein